ncbi:hypothetical protein [Listeria innocua]|uniref:hypothetical protein n=1 Tax=Listeria innocua TaxID=1642 RepID=UPI00162AE2BB|nr:hypothetical protein [Listeria innocua]MBC1377871.1 hypothetical protein [Listeria innocua]
MDGWIKLHRSILESDTYNFLSLHQKLIMIEILLRANFSDGFWLDKKTGKKVELKAGQLITSINKIKVEWLKNEKQISDKKIRNTLEKLQKLDFLSIKTTNNYTVLTVCNYSDYQRDESEKGEQKGNAGANKGQSEGKVKAKQGQQCKKEKKEKKKKNNNKNNNKRQNKFDDAHLSLAKLLVELIKKNNPEEKDHDLEKWAHDIRVMIEQDKRDIEKVKNTIIWSQNNDFWCGVIKSPKSLRKNYDQMATLRNKTSTNKPFNKYSKPVKQEVLPNWYDKDQQEAPKQPKLTEEEEKELERKVAEIKKRLAAK